ncbi:sugar phosphate nucleotidyltransferase [uncultured Methanobrevibacter sp.]|uniref:sugar phosphate nucleotidyltransferase n=1 Tax=uncultured Methanobrevibacter sp. TaxID=253161 RepID=UPI002625F447|nr:sugar phosphate nucleotidyltransferase [uncultured Methanobrevibacter sp.]
MMETVGMILCGGLGKRLRPVTETVPKPLIEIKDDYTILDKQLFDFKNAGVDEVYLLTGFLHEKIKERYGDEYNGVKIHYVIEDEPLGTLNAIRLGMEAINGDKQCIIRNGDIVSDVNIKAMIEYGVKSSLPAIMFVTQMQSPYGIVEMNGDRLVSFKEKPILEDYYINGGIYFTKSKIDFGEFKTGDIEKIYFPTIAKENNLGYFKENGIYWIAVDTYKELEAVKKEYENKTDKPWGYEKILILTEMYSTKELYIKEGFRTSLHYHIEKDETMYILSGSGYIEFEDKKEYFSKNDSIRIQPGVVHSIVATENTLLHEVSTPYLEDTVCIEDYYVR